MTLARQIGTYAISTEPFADCCPMYSAAQPGNLRLNRETRRGPRRISISRPLLSWERIRLSAKSTNMRTVRRCSKKPENAGRRRSGAQPFGRRTFAAAALAALALSPCARADETASATAAGLELVNLDLLDSRDGYAIPADSRYFPGEDGSSLLPDQGLRVSNDYRVDLEYRLEALDPDGKRIYGAEGGRFDTDLAPQDEEWMPVVRYSPEIPAHAGGGTYKIEIEVRDRLAGAAVRASVPIVVDGSRVETSDRLAIRNFGFAKAAGGAKLDEPL